MSAQTMVQIRDDSIGLTITITVPGRGYNPDLLDDVKRRAVDGFDQAFKIRYPEGTEVVPNGDDDQSG